MEIKEKDLYLAKLLEENAIKQDEFEDIEYKPEINAFCSKYLSAIFIDNINFGWSVWQAKTPPEGFVLIGRECPDPIFADNLFADLKTRSFIYDGDEFINLCDIDPIVVWKMVIEAQEQSHE